MCRDIYGAATIRVSRQPQAHLCAWTWVSTPPQAHAQAMCIDTSPHRSATRRESDDGGSGLSRPDVDGADAEGRDGASGGAVVSDGRRLFFLLFSALAPLWVIYGYS